MYKDTTNSIITSFALHAVVLVLLCTNIFTIHIQQTSNLMEIELASAGDINLKMGGTGEGEMEKAQPIEDTKETKKESEILPDDIPEENELKEVEKDSVKQPDNVKSEGAFEDVNVKKDEAPDPNVLIEKEKVEKKEEVINDSAVLKKPKRRRKIVDLLAREKKESEDVNSSFDDLFNKINKKDELGLKNRKKNISSKVKGDGGGGGSHSLTDADTGLIRRQIIPHWYVPSGIRDAENLLVELQVKMQEDGSINASDIIIIDTNRYENDNFYRVAVDSAKRALLQASPLKIPRDKVQRFRNFKVVFDPKDALK